MPMDPRDNSAEPADPVMQFLWDVLQPGNTDDADHEKWLGLIEKAAGDGTLADMAQEYAAVLNGEPEPPTPDDEPRD